jgi:benzylsuccinate CoA-transferase BbsE subunit
MFLGADLVLEDSTPGLLRGLGLGAEAAIALRPGLVYTSITPFGQTGPYAFYQYTDLICMAFGGMLWMGGYADDVPVQAAGEQAYMAGSLYGAVASMIGLTHAELHGEGQHVDVSVQEAVAMGLENAAQYYDLNRHIRTRFGGGQREAGFGVFPCADGYVFLLAAGIGGNRFWPNMVQWLLAEGTADAEELATPPWGYAEFMKTDAAKQRFWDIFTPYSRSRTKRELYRASQSWRVPLGPVNTPSDISGSEQLRSRGYFVDVDWFGRLVEMPGAPYGLSATPWTLTGPPPQPGADTDDVLADFGFSRDAIGRARSSGVLG